MFTGWQTTGWYTAADKNSDRKS